jgi:hypothetical protein
MPKIYLINVGANSSHQKEARSVIFRNGSFRFVTYPDEYCDTQYPKFVRDYVSDPINLRTHLDPDLTNMTYGDYCANRRARALLAAEEGDVLIFWGLLWRMTEPREDVWDCNDRGWYVIGAIRIETILESGQGVAQLKSAQRQRALSNAHMVGARVDSRELVRVFLGDMRHSARFDFAVDFEVYQDHGLMQKVVRSSDGRSIEWKESPRWNSVTRSCRAILDLGDSDGRKRAKILEQRIHSRNPGYRLLAGIR